MMDNSLGLSEEGTSCASLGGAMELADAVTITFPSQWAIVKLRDADAQIEIKNMAKTIQRGTAAVVGLYMRMCQTIRQSTLSDAQVRDILSDHFNDQRISEILRVSRAPEQVYQKYTAGFFGFKAALRECRGYRIMETEDLHRRKLRRAARRLVELTSEPMELEVQGRVVSIR